VGRFVVIGETARVTGFALGGASVVCAERPEDVRLAWASLPEDAAVVILTKRAAEALGSTLRADGQALIAVMPP
jgi:vacuolar-type H+-ATPase subunit F/Vma7